jgi:tagatose kinase
MGSSLFSAEMIAGIRKAVGIVKSRGGLISFDPNIRAELLRHAEVSLALRSILKDTDIFLPSGEEVTLLVNTQAEGEAIDSLLELGIREIVVKRGSSGCSGYDGARQLNQAAYPVREIDPTGAGDCFSATYVACRLKNKDVESSLRYAAAAGAIAVTRQGPMEGVSTFAQLDSFLLQQDTRPNRLEQPAGRKPEQEA